MGFQVQEEEAKGVLEEEGKEGHVDAEPDSQLEDLQYITSTYHSRRSRSMDLTTPTASPSTFNWWNDG
ncbi:hypothetical protein K443DRAFT_15385 [Laccaria amethystina LaAM-08-1]|uniref:Uncharacterized protein n=1 Tax=Laccaria amethystina LaAM-08-1 TaxID=1095629 RepID=A0A0C9WR17_9AGAR|nr:hypothetical protein K443DRAFT_15385 [Laccaria amethystina LaAM-08-1]